jgi:hypothetical protein
MEEGERKRKRNYCTLKGVIAVTPIITNCLGGFRRAAEGPKANIFHTTLGNRSQIFVNAIEDQVVSSFPNIPSDGRGNCCQILSLAVR